VQLAEEGGTPVQLDDAALNAALVKTVAAFEQLTPVSVAQFDQIYAATAYFKDPFNEFEGIENIKRVFAHMFVALNEPRFEVTAQFGRNAEAFLSWNFLFKFKDTQPDVLQCIRGSTHLKFSADGRVVYHRDYWDAAEELYEKIPYLGGLMRWIKRRAAG
jgi:hypothetical protein